MASPSFSSREFREALSSFATGVTIVTACDAAGEPVGMTASSFNSVSMDPPLILWSVTKTALSAQAFHDAKTFCVHVLTADQVELANRFARSGEDKFGDLDFAIADCRPTIKDVATRFDCDQWAVHEGGDHWIIIGEVRAIERANLEPLVFGGGSYSTASPLRSGSGVADMADSEPSPIDGLLIYNLSRAYHQMAGQFHETVRASGLTLTEWRILASLHGVEERGLPDLATRTFVDPEAVQDILAQLADDGLCTINGSGADLVVRETSAGRDRVEHLFELGTEIEKQAIGSDDPRALTGLIEKLRKVIANTDPVV